MSRGGRILGAAPHDGPAKPRAGAAAESRGAIADAVQRAAYLAWRAGRSAVRRNRATHDHRDPDITRLLDRLEKRGLIVRWRDVKDRRMVLARITPEGLKMLHRLDEPIQQGHRKQLGHLGRERLKALCELLRAARREP